MSTIQTILNEHIDWRNQIFKLAKADIIKTYSGAALGWSWAFVKPLITISVFWFAFTYGLRGGGPIEGYPFILWMIPGFIAWFYMSDMLTQGAGCIRKYKFLVTKMKFPVSTIPTFMSMSKLTIHLILMVIVFAIFIITGHYPDVYWLQLPFYMLCMIAFFTAWALFASMMSAMSVDFLNLVKSVTQAIFWLSGIMWDINRIQSPKIQFIMHFNPVTYIATGYRNCFIYKVWFWEQTDRLAIYLIVLIVMVMLALWAYKKLIREIPDVL